MRTRHVGLLILTATTLVAAGAWLARSPESAAPELAALDREEIEEPTPPSILAPARLRGSPGAAGAPAPELPPVRPGMPAAPPAEATPTVTEEAGTDPTDRERIEALFDDLLSPPARFPARPARVDPALGDPRRRLRIERSRMLAEPSLDRALPSWGVIELDHDDAGATIEEEIEAPLVTAIHGTVLSAEGPVVEAEVVVYSTFYQRHAQYDRHVREVGRTFTQRDGSFDLRPIGLDTVHFGGDGDLWITVRRVGYGSIVGRRLLRIEPEQENDVGSFPLDAKPQVLEGTVRDRGGRPVVGAAIRVSGSINPVRYDKVERMVILKDCPTTFTDEEGRYRLTGFAPGLQQASIHVNVDCVLRRDFNFDGTPISWSPTVLAGKGVRGVVLDPEGRGVAAAVVSGGGNWTPTNADGTFWLDNVEDGPFSVQVAHHLWHSVRAEGVEAGQEDVELRLDAPLARFSLFVVDADASAPVPLIAIDWWWENGPRPHAFVPESRYWHAGDGRYDLVVPEEATRASVSAEGFEAAALAAEDLVDGRGVTIQLARAGALDGASPR